MVHTLVEHQVLDRQQRIDRGGIGHRLDGHEIQLGTPLGDIQPFFGAALHQAGEVGRGRELGPQGFGPLVRSTMLWMIYWVWAT